MGQTLTQGQVFAGYRIERLLGAGGMGEVYLAHDRDLPRFIALKLLTHATADDEVRARFQREADTVARLSHPNIVAVHARGQQDDQLWIAMEYVDGTDVAAALHEGPLHPAHAVRIITEAARALDHAHHSGFLHRDVKPANILLARGAQERVLLADFGIAKALDETSGLTRTGDVHASFQYAAPELFDLQLEIDRRADIYALGCTLYHMVTGVLPYPGTSVAQLINAHLNYPVPQPTRDNPALPTGFDDVIARALAKDPRHRFDSCGELAMAAAGALAKVPLPQPDERIPQPPDDPQPPGHLPQPSDVPRATGHLPQPLGPIPRTKRRRTPLIAAIATGLVLVLGGIGAAILLAERDSTTQQNVQTEAEQAACDFVRNLVTYDYRNLDTYHSAIGDRSTGAYKAKFESGFPATRSNYTTLQSTGKAGDVQCSYRSGDSERATVAATGTHDVSGGSGSSHTFLLEMVLTLVRVDGRWLCSELENIPPTPK